MTLCHTIYGTIHLRRWQIFKIFDPYPPTIGIPAKCLWRGFLILKCCDLLTVGTWGHPSPLRHADVLNGWSLCKNLQSHCSKSFWCSTVCRLIGWRNEFRYFPLDSWIEQLSLWSFKLTSSKSNWFWYRNQQNCLAFKVLYKNYVP